MTISSGWTGDAGHGVQVYGGGSEGHLQAGHCGSLETVLVVLAHYDCLPLVAHLHRPNIRDPAAVQLFLSR